MPRMALDSDPLRDDLRFVIAKNRLTVVSPLWALWPALVPRGPPGATGAASEHGERGEMAATVATRDGRTMDNLEEATRGLLGQLDEFCGDMKQIIMEESPVGFKTEKVSRLREKILGEIETLTVSFEQQAQEKEKDLMAQMARLRQLRDQVSVIRHGVMPMFGSQPRTE